MSDGYDVLIIGSGSVVARSRGLADALKAAGSPAVGPSPVHRIDANA
jgi:transketolase C-terminal domain/subunit